MNYKNLIVLFVLLISTTLVTGIGNTMDENGTASAVNLVHTFYEKNKTVIIRDPSDEKILFEIEQVSVEPDLITMEEVFRIKSYEKYAFDNENDFKVRWEKFEGKKNILKSKWEIYEEVEYSATVPDFIEVRKEIMIENIQSTEDVTNIYDSNPWLLDFGELHTTNKWNVTFPNGTVTIGFDDHVVNSTDPLDITFYCNTTEQIDTHIEPKYRMEWRPFSPEGKKLKKDESIIVKLTFQKKAEKGAFAIKTIPTFAGVEEENFTWWNGSWNYCVNNQIPNGIRPYQLPVTMSNSVGTNTETNIYFNGHANPDFSDIRITLDDTTILPYWIEDNGPTGKVWVNVIDNGVVNIYYGNPPATDLSDGKSTFEFFDDFSDLDLGSNPVIYPTEPWENPDLRWGTIAYLNGIYYMYYTSGSSATADIGRATSTDLIQWTKYEQNPMIQDRIGPSLLKELDGFTPVLYDNKYWMLTMKYDGTAIELRSAPSIDSNDWTLENGNLISKVSGSWFENDLYTTSFVRENDKYYIGLEGRDSGNIWRIGLFDGGSSPTGPYVDQGVLLSATLPWEGGAILDPEMRKFDDTYYLFYTGNNDKPVYQNSYATSSALSGPYIKSDIKITPVSNTYPAILEKDDYYYIVTDDLRKDEGIGKNLFRRKDLSGMFGSPFEWYQGGSPTVSNSELLINEDGEYIRSQSAFLYKAMKIRAKFDAPTSYQYFGFAANNFAGVTNSEMIVSYDTPELKAWSGNSANQESSSIYDTSYFGSYHDYEILWRNGEAKFIVDDVLKSTQTTYVADTPQPIGIYNYKTNADLNVDWIFVRNYAVPELAWATWSEEYTFQPGNSPIITDFSPVSPVDGYEGRPQTFSINIDQTVDVVWYLNEVEVKNETGVTHASYRNTGTSVGTWNIKAVASNNIGDAIQTWAWIVTSGSTSPGITFIDPTPANGALLTQDQASINTLVTDSSTAFIDWDNSLVGWWRFNNENGEDSTYFKDWSSSGNDVACSGINCPASTTGKFGKALSFDGSNSYIFQTSTSGMPVTSPFTFELWVNADSVAYWMDIFRKEGSWAVQIDPSGKLNFEVTGKQDTPSNAIVPVNIWTHMAITFEGSTVKFYKDGILTDTIDDIQVPDPGSNTIFIGGYGDWYFNGALDEIKIHNRILSPEEIRASYDVEANDLYRDFANLTDGTYHYKGYSQNLLGSVGETEIRTLTISSTATSPEIIFTDPTPADGTAITHDHVSINTMISDSSTAFIDWDNSLVGWWSFNYESGEDPTLLRDSSSWGNDVTCSGTNYPSSASGKFGNALNFDGSNDYISRISANGMPVTSPFTFELWVNAESVSYWMDIFRKEGSWAVQIDPKGKLNFEVTGKQDTPSNAIVPVNVWTHLAVTYEENTVKFYKDGILTDTIDQIEVPDTGTNAIYIGGYSDWYFHGVLDEVKLHNRILSPEEIKALYDAETHGLYRDFTNLAGGTYQYKAYSQNLLGIVDQTQTRTLTVTLPSSPNITGFTPLSLASNVEGESREFTINIDQNVNVMWYLNDEVVQDNENNVIQATYTHDSASIGTWNLRADVSNSNGDASQSWTWIVSAIPTSPEIIFSDTSPADGASINQNHALIKTSVSDSSTAFIDWDNSLAGWWRFNSDSDETATLFKDWSSFGNDVTCSGTNCPTSTSGKFGTALSFDGLDDSVSKTTATGIPVTSPFTFELWVNPQSISNWMDIFRKEGSWAVQINPNGKLNLEVTGKQDSSSSAVVPVNVWTHLAVTFEGTTVNFYKDGILTDTTNQIEVPDVGSNSIYIGGHGSWYFNGALDEIKIHNRVLSPEEIQASYDAKTFDLSRDFTNLAGGIYHYQGYTQDLLGNVGQTGTRTLTVTSQSAPTITDFTPPSPVNSVEEESRKFSINIDQNVDVTWYLNDEVVQDDEKDVVQASYTNNSASTGTWNIRANASNSNGEAVQTWTWNVSGTTPTPTPKLIPTITDSNPSSSVNNVEGESREFTIKIDQNVNVTWYLNDEVVQDDENNVKQASYTNNSSSTGTWNIRANASNSNGEAVQTWTWIVSGTTSTSPEIIFTDPTPADGASINQNHALIKTSVSDYSTAFIDWDNSLAGWWRFNSESGETATLFKDWSSLGNDVTCSGTNCPTSTPGKFGDALSFDGMDDFVSTNTATGIPAISPFTFESWVNAQSISNWMDIFRKEGSWAVQIDSNGKINFEVTGKQDIISNVVIPVNVWTHLAVTLEENTIKFYKDGILTDTINPVNLPDAGSNSICFGGHGSWYFNGALDEIKIHNRILSTEEIQASYDAKTFDLYRDFTNLSGGIYQYQGYAQDLSGIVGQTGIRAVTVTLPNAPTITDSTPSSTVSNDEGESRDFTIKLDQNINVTWYLNDEVVQDDENNVKQATYTNDSASTGTWNIRANASNSNGEAVKIWTWNVSGTTPTPTPTITNSTPSLSVNNVEGESREFTIKIDQNVNVTWYLNDEVVQDDENNVKQASYTNNSASTGTWNIRANASNSNGEAVQTWTWNVSGTTPTPTPTPIPTPIPTPTITNSTPSSSVNNAEGESREFTINIDQNVNVTWYLNNEVVQDDEKNVKKASYINNSSSTGTWNIRANASNSNGEAIQTWTWNVSGTTPTPTPKPIPIPIPTITNSTPSSSVNNVEGESREFTINIDQNVNVTWYLNNEVVKDDEKNVKQASYTNNSSSIGTWNIRANATNSNGDAVQTWTWIVSGTTSTSPEIIFTDPTPADGATITQDHALIKTSVSDSSTAFIDWDNSLAGWWRFNSESGETATLFKDWSSLGNDVTCSETNCPTSTSGKFGDALSFDGLGDFVSTNTATGIPVTSPFTFESWVNAQSISDWMDIFRKEGSWAVQINPDGKINFEVTGKQDTISNVIIPVNVWTYLAVTLEENTVNFYKDGILTDTINIVNVPDTGSNSIYFGGHGSWYFNGVLDEIKIHNRVLSPEEIQASYDVNTFDLYRDFTNLSGGIYQYQGYVQDLSGNVGQTGTRALTVTLPNAPTITDSTPSSTISNNEGESREFTIKIDQNVNVTWYLNDEVVQDDENNVKQASYTNNSASTGTWSIRANATNSNGEAVQTWTWNVSGTTPTTPITPTPTITNSTPSSSVNNVEAESRKFTIKIDQNVDVTWYLNDEVVQDDEKNVKKASYTNNSASTGTWDIRVNASNSNGEAVQTWTWNVSGTTPTPTPTPIPIPIPTITNSTPSSSVNNFVGESREFTINIDQNVDVTWYLNDEVVQDDAKNAKQASYTNSSASIGTWNIRANATNSNGEAVQTWTWIVSGTITSISPKIIFTDPTPVDGATITQDHALIKTIVSDSSTALIDWDNSLAGWWRFNSESGETATFFKDWSSFGNDVTCSGVNCPTSTSGKFGNALSFDGLDNAVSKNTAIGIPVTSPFTFETWVNAQSVSYWMDIFRNEGSWAVQINPDGKINLEITGKQDTISEVVVPVNIWTHLAVTFEGTTINFYKDGILTDTKNQLSVPDTGSNSIYIGGYNSWYFNGALDEIKIHNRVLSPGEIQASYDAKTFDLYRDFTTIADGTYHYQGYVQDLSGNVGQTEARTLTVTLPGTP